jgi:hypothetical protein
MPEEPAGVVREHGDIFFFYRPRIDVEELRSLEDIQRFFFVLQPDRGLTREIVIGTKRLPDPDRHERAWAFVAGVWASGASLRGALGERVYETKTRGLRVQPAARPAGEGRYKIVEHSGHGHLAYTLELPPDLGEAQTILGIAAQASYIVAVRNPNAPAPAGIGSSRRAPELPNALLSRFGDRRFAPLDTPEWLDYDGVELVLIAAARAPERELGVELDAEDQRLEDADLFRDLGLDPSDLPLDPLATGDLR